MPDINDVFGGNSLKSEDLKGREITVTIQSVQPREFTSQEGKTQKKLVITFVKAKKFLICNSTNAHRIAFMFGNDYSLWPGKSITLFVDNFIQFGNEIKSGIRVKPPEAATIARVPQPTPAPVQQEPRDSLSVEMSDDIPF